MTGWRQLLSGVMLVTVLSPVWAAGEEGALQIRGRIADQAQIISSSQEHLLSQLLAQHEFSQHQHVALLTVETAGGETVHDYAARLWHSWQPRSKAASVLLVLFKEQKVAVIFAGEEFSKVLDAATIKQITEGEVAGNLQRGDFDNAAMEGVKAIVGELNR